MSEKTNDVTCMRKLTQNETGIEWTGDFFFFFQGLRFFFQ